MIYLQNIRITIKAGRQYHRYIVLEVIVPFSFFKWQMAMMDSTIRVFPIVESADGDIISAEIQLESKEV